MLLVKEIRLVINNLRLGGENQYYNDYVSEEFEERAGAWGTFQGRNHEGYIVATNSVL
jgi:hypothetical protein